MGSLKMSSDGYMKTNRGGKREGAGRPRKEPTVRIRVPVSLVQRVIDFIKMELGK